ncbi:MAG: 16S rRNA (guanine(1405)-N(7))-methyltransferase RmtF [Clostridiales bacterium]|nr:16S rRNA (guanine(1405)-N(7))-methyltransferase RmtF [Clostridiales bacterium]
MNKKYRDLSPDAVERVYARERANRRGEKEADKAARAALHAMSGAYLPVDSLPRARRCMAAWLAGDRGALAEALRLHASTRERMGIAEQLYGAIFAACGGRPASILDLACGFNPLYLGNLGHAVRGVDVHGGAAALVNDWAAAAGWDVRVGCGDLLSGGPLPVCELALMMKLMPLLEAERKGSAMELLSRVPAKKIAVSFPTRTLGGRGVGMERHYGQWFEQNLPPGRQIVDRIALPGELTYVVEEVGSCPGCTS